MTWLKKFGEEVLKVFAVVLGVAQKVAPVAEAILPTYAPLIAEGADVITAAAKYINWLDGAAGSFIAGSTLDQKMTAITAFVSQAVQQWFAANFPGTAQVADKAAFTGSLSMIGRGVSDALASVESTASIAKASAAELGTDVLSKIAQLVQWAEFTGAALLPDIQSGPQKASAIAGQVDALLRDWVTTVLGSAVKDTTKWATAVAEIQNGVVGILNSLKPTVTTATPLTS